MGSYLLPDTLTVRSPAKVTANEDCVKFRTATAADVGLRRFKPWLLLHMCAISRAIPNLLIGSFSSVATFWIAMSVSALVSCCCKRACSQVALPDDIAEDDAVRELLPSMAAMANALPDAYREALRRTEYEGLSQKQLSEQLGISFSGAKSRVQRARARIKEQLLECCHFELDHAGRIIDYQPHCACCAGINCDTACSN